MKQAVFFHEDLKGVQVKHVSSNILLLISFRIRNRSEQGIRRIVHQDAQRLGGRSQTAWHVHW